MITDIPMVIFAGGKSSRMGKDKALLPFGGYNSLAQYQFERLNKIFERVYISAKDDKFDFNPPLIIDTYEINSPLAAIISVLKYTQEPTFILSVDAPLVDKQIITDMISGYNSNTIATIANTSNGLEPLCGIYNGSFIHKAIYELNRDNHKINYILKHGNITTIDFEDTSKFLNLNYPKDYKKALSILHQ